MSIALFALTLASCQLGQIQSAVADPMKFGALTATDLNGKRYALPGEFNGGPVLCVVSRSDKDRDEARRVSLMKADLETNFPTLSVYELYFTSTPEPLGVIVTNATERPYVLTTPFPGDSWLESAGLAKHTTPVVVVVRNDGTVTKYKPTSLLTTREDVVAFVEG